jgi:hypothetical protein
MAQQLIYTSAGKLLDAGRSGFGTVARSKTLSPLLVSAIERVSQFANIRGTDRTRVLLVHRKIVAANNRIHLLSRIADAGADYTGRTNHIAHHLIVSQEEMARAAARGLTPADILIQFSWLKRWDGAPRFFDASDDVPLESLQPLGSQAGREEWSRVTGNPAHARLFAWDGAPRSGVLLVPRGTNPLPLLAQALREFGSQCWTRTFTTSLETTDEIPDFDWIVSTPENFPEIQGRCGSRTVLDLSQPHALPQPPEPVQILQNPAGMTTAASAAPISVRSGEAVDSTNPQVERVKVSAASGTSPLSSARRPSSSSSHQRRAIIILSAAAAVVMLSVLGFAAYKTLGPDGGKAADSKIQQANAKNKIINQLKDVGISKQNAEHIADNEKADDWKAFIVTLIKYVREVKSHNPFSDVSAPPIGPLPDGAAAWLQPMIDVHAALNDYSKITDRDALIAKLNVLGKASKSPKLADPGLPKGFQTAFGKLDEAMVEKELDCRRSSPLSQDDFKQLHEAFIEGQFSETEWPDRYKLLSIKFPNDFERIKKIDTVTDKGKTIPSSQPNEVAADSNC